MKPAPKSTPICTSVDDALLAPWAATGALDDQDSRLFEAAMVSDPSLDGDLAAACAERAAAIALGKALGRPSARPMLELFAAIDAEENLGPNVTRLKCPRPRITARSGYKVKKVCSLR